MGPVKTEQPNLILAEYLCDEYLNGLLSPLYLLGELPEEFNVNEKSRTGFTFLTSFRGGKQKNKDFLIYYLLVA